MDCDFGETTLKKAGLAHRLMDFAVKMRFTGKLNEDRFEKMCAEDKQNVFEHLLTTTLPVQDIEALKKVAFLQSVKRNDELPKSVNKQFNLAKQKAALESQVSARYDKIAKKEEQFTELATRASKLCREVQQFASVDEDFKRKTFLLTMNSSLIKDKLSVCEELLSRTQYFNKSFNLKRESSREETMEILLQCAECVGSFLEASWNVYGDQTPRRLLVNDSDHTGSPSFQGLAQFHEKKKSLKDFIKANVTKLSAKELMEAVILLQQDLNAQILSLESCVDLVRDANQLKTEQNIASSGQQPPGLLELTVLHLQFEAEVAHLKRINTLKQKQMEVLTEELVQHLSELRKNSVSSILTYHMLSCKNKYLQEELQNLEEYLRDLGYFQWTNQKQRAEIIVLDNKRSRLLNFINPNLNRTQMSRRLALEQEKKVLSKLWNIDNKCFRTVQDSVTKLEGAVIQEVKLFLQNPLNIFQQVILPDGSQLPSYKMLVNYRNYMTENDQALCLYGAPTDPVEDIVMKVYQQKCFYFMQKWSRSQHQKSNLSIIESRAKEFQNELSYLLLECQELQAVLQDFANSSELGTDHLRNSLKTWEQLSSLPVLYDLPALEGKTFLEWENLYDGLLCLYGNDESFLE